MHWQQKSVFHIFAYSLLLGLLAYPVYAAIRGYALFEMSGYGYLEYSGFATLAFFLLIGFQYFKRPWFNLRFPWLYSRRKRLALEVVSTFLYSALVASICYFGLIYVWEMDAYIPSWLLYFLSGSAFSFIVLGVLNFNDFFEAWQDAHHRYANLEKEQAITKLQLLQTQLSPHFLFNNLNILDALIMDNATLARQYLKKLADLYRYMLSAQSRELVVLEEEVEFVQDYFYLFKTRYEEKLTCQFEIDKEWQNSLIPPGTLQILVENAIRHNEISAKRPLEIRISTNTSYLYVSNNIQKKKNATAGAGIGLHNITERYRFLSDLPVEIAESQEEFTIKLPKLTTKNHEDTHSRR